MRTILLNPFTAVALTTLLGCTTSGKKLATIQAEKEQLLTTISAQRDTVRAQNDKIASLETRLDQAEKELARAGSPTRISTRPPSGRIGDPPAAAKSEPLPWRTPSKTDKADASKSDSKSSDSRPATGSRAASAVSSILALSRADSRVSYDAASRAAKIDVPIAFAGSTAGLTAADKLQLDEVAKLLRSDDARELRIMVAGSTAGPHTAGRQLATTRAQAVADYLDRHGIAHDRLAVSGTSGRSSATSDRAADNGVEIYLFDADSPVAGWAQHQPLRR